MVDPSEIAIPIHEKKIFGMHKIITLIIALVWVANGLYCKILNLVPRHQEIVAAILGTEHARLLTILIGTGEIMLGILILARFQSRKLAMLQMILVITMNVIEFLVVPDLLLWGRFNTLFALGFVLLIYYNEFVLVKQK